MFCVLLQPEESEGSVYLSSSGTEGGCEGSSKTAIILTLAENVFLFLIVCLYMLCLTFPQYIQYSLYLVTRTIETLVHSNAIQTNLKTTQFLKESDTVRNVIDSTLW